MTFMKPFTEGRKKIENLKEKVLQEKLECDDTLEQLNLELEAAVQNGDFNKAEELNQDIVKLKIEIDTKQTYLHILGKENRESLKRAAIESVLLYQMEQDKHFEVGEKINLKLVKARNEYLKVAQEAQINNSLLHEKSTKLAAIGRLVNQSDDSRIKVEVEATGFGRITYPTNLDLLKVERHEVNNYTG